MDARFTTLKRILDLFSQHEQLSPAEIMSFSGLQKSVVHKYLAQLLREGRIQKTGKVPHVHYFIPGSSLKDNEEEELISFTLDFKTRKLIDDIFFKFSATGKKQLGFKGMQKWCQERGLDIERKLKDYIKIYMYIESEFDNCGMLHADDAFGKDFDKKYLDAVLYADQYKYMDFGRGKLAEMTFFAKTSQNKDLIAESLAEILPKLECLITRENFDAIAITPWSIERKNQLLGALKKEVLVFKLPFVNVIKYYEDGIAIPQKSLKTRAQRIENARNTIFIDDKNIGKYKKVLLIDDFVGSGATLNETAKKLKNEGVLEVIGFAFVGNTNLSYDVINEI